MSYCRFGEGDAYIYTTGLELICQSCVMDEERHSFITHSRSTMLVHAHLHRVRGDYIPGHVFERLKREIETEGDEVGDGLRSEDPPTDEGAGGADAAGADEGTTT